MDIEIRFHHSEAGWKRRLCSPCMLTSKVPFKLENRCLIFVEEIAVRTDILT